MIPECVTVHHEAGNQGFEGVNEYHRQRWLKQFGTEFRSSLGYSIGYHWYWDKRKGWIQGRAEDEEGAHTLDGWNRKSVGVCLQGNYALEALPEDVKAILRAKVDEIRTRWDIPQTAVYGHKELQKSKLTECPAGLMEFVREYRGGDVRALQEQVIALSKKVIKLLVQLRDVLLKKP